MTDNRETVTTKDAVRPHQLGEGGFKAVLPDEIDWKPFAAFPRSVRLAVIVGQPSQNAPYTIRVKVPHGVKLMPHKHPEDRVYTVMSGIFYIGLGEQFDPDKLEAYPPASVVVLRAALFISIGRNPVSTSRKSLRLGRLPLNISTQGTIRETARFKRDQTAGGARCFR